MENKNKLNKIIIVLVVIIIALVVALITTVLLLNKAKKDNTSKPTKEVLNNSTVVKEKPTAEASENYKINGENYKVKLEYYFINSTKDEEEGSYTDNYKYKLFINDMLIKESTTSIFCDIDRERGLDEEYYTADNIIKINISHITLSSLTDEATNDTYIVLKSYNEFEEPNNSGITEGKGELLVINKDYKIVDTFTTSEITVYEYNDKALPYVKSNRLLVLNTDNIEKSVLTTYKYENGSKVEVKSENIDLSDCGENQDIITFAGECW